MKLKKIIFDASTLISLSSSCLFNAVGKTLEDLNSVGIISTGVEMESITRPIKVKRFELNATRIRHGLKAGWFELAKLDKSCSDEVKKVMGLANSCLSGPKGSLELLQLGEVEALVLAERLGAKVVAVDERTTRMLAEEPEKLRRLIGKRRHEKIRKNAKKARDFSGRFGRLSFVRSSELVALSFERGFLEEEIGKGKKALEAALYALKYNGCALSSFEIEKFLEGGH